MRQISWLTLDREQAFTAAVLESRGYMLYGTDKYAQVAAEHYSQAIKQATAEGLGLACLSLCAVQDLVTLGRLVVLRTTLPRLTRRFYLVHHQKKRLSGNLQRFVAHCERLEGITMAPDKSPID